jgi:hypothetical protein
MAEDIETGNGRHWSEPGSPAAPKQSTPAERQQPTGDLPGPPPTSITPVGGVDASPDSAPRPVSTQDRDRGNSENGATPASRPQQPWGHPAPPQKQPPAAAAPGEERGAAPAPAQQWGAPPAPGQQRGAPQKVLWPPGPAAAPRRQPGQTGQFNQDVTEEIKIPTLDRRLRQAVPDRQQAVGRAAQADQYRRPGAPIQAASAGIRQEIISIEVQAPVANTGWRGEANKAGLKLKPGKKEKRRREVYRRIRAPKDAMYAIAVLTLKGGAGKTTVAAALGQVFSSIRSDGVIAVDADPDAGDLPAGRGDGYCLPPGAVR